MVHHQGQSSALTLEAEAIRAIGSALSALPDDEARARVLRWASERFGLDLRTVPAGGDALCSDATLVVGDLHEFFDRPARRDAAPVESDAIEMPAPPDAPFEPPPVDDGTLDALDGDLAEALTPSPGAGAEFETAVHEVVAELQRLARDWDTAFAAAPKSL